MTAAFLFLDTETGGLDARIHPLVSVAMIATEDFRANLAITDTFYARVKPPAGTLLEIPVTPEFEGFNPLIQKLVDCEGNEYRCDPKGLPLDSGLHDRPRITAGAAKVNGFTWEKWNGTSIELKQLDATFAGFIEANFGKSKPYTLAHNASFDEKFLSRWMPAAHSRLRQPWLCTCTTMRKWRKASGNPGGSKLVDLATMANEDPSTPAYQGLQTKEGQLLTKAHDALADTQMCRLGAIWLAYRYYPLNQW